MADTDKIDRVNVDVGLALGGLAGNNAFGAGVLQAALDCDLDLQMISCTSGQIHWVDRFLKARKKTNPRGELRRRLEADVRALKPTGVEALDSALIGLLGKKDVFRLALPELPLNALANLQAALITIGSSGISDPRTLFSCYHEFFKIIPAQILVPTFPDSFFQSICDALNSESEIGIVFNSYDFHAGTENVYLNKRAKKMLGVNFKQTDHYRDRTIYRELTPDAVRQGLWLYEYGAPAYGPAIDGAYFRQVMLSELARASTIYVARPINSRWIGPFPRSWLALQDMKTEVNFNGSYAGERDKIMLMNRLIRDKALSKKMKRKKNYHHVELDEFEIPTQEGYFDYSAEDIDVFDQVYEKAADKFSKAEHRNGGRARPSPAA